MRRKPHQSVLERGDGNNRITPNYPIIALIKKVRGKRWASLRSAPTYDFTQHTKYDQIK
jgi:hypothetical protein